MSSIIDQYRAIKESLPKTTLLLFRLGDFYEVFEDDAKVVANVLQIATTRRKDVLMAGVPYWVLEKWTHQLVQAGHEVAVCDPINETFDVYKPGE